MNASQERLCFVTVGATAAFKDLVRAVLAEPFLSALSDAGYKHLRVQYGKDGLSVFDEALLALGLSTSDHPRTTRGLSISGFDFKQDGLDEELILAKKHGASAGMVVSHAGSGSILSALRIDVPLIVVPNASLLDNHQLELAEELEKQGYVVHGELDNLAAAVVQAEQLRRKKQAWPPRDAAHDPSGRGLMGVLDDEMGFVD